MEEDDKNYYCYGMDKLGLYFIAKTHLFVYGKLKTSINEGL